MRRWLLRNAACLLTVSAITLPSGLLFAEDPPAKQDSAKKDESKKPSEDDSVKATPEAEWKAIQNSFKTWMEATQKGFQEAKDRNAYRKERMATLVPMLERALNMAEKHTTAPEALEAINWATTYGREQEAVRKRVGEALNKIAAGLTLDSFPEKLLRTPMPGYAAMTPKLLELVKAKPNHAKAEELLGWIAQTGAYGGSKEISGAYNASIELIADKYPKSKSVQALLPLLAFDSNPPWAIKMVRKFAEANKEGKAALLSNYALGALLSKEEATSKEGIALLEKFVEEAKKAEKDRMLANYVGDAEETIETARIIGQPVKEIDGEDLEGKKFKLSDYKGKVVLLDFWGFW